MKLEGEQVERDVEGGLRLLESGVAQASDAAAANLGYAYHQGVGVAADPEKARHWLDRAAELGSAAALNTLGWLSQHPDGGEADLDRAVNLYVEAVGRGNMLAIGNLDNLLVPLQLEEEQVEAIAARLEELAGLGSSGARAALAHFYYDGMLYHPQHRERAVQHALPAAEEGWPLAMWVLGRAYDMGHGVEQDQGRATYWLERGASLGSGGCMLRLGYNHLAGKGVPKSVERGLDWLQRGAETGFLPAINFLAEVYERGHFGVERDPDLALEWVRKAAERGDEAARGRLRFLELEQKRR
jgi:hypothetical protein